MSARAARAAALAFSLLAGCARAPEATPAAPAASSAEVAPTTTTAASADAAIAAAVPVAKTTPGPSAAPGAPSASVVTSAAASPAPTPFEPLLDASGQPLPQTDARPSATSPAFERRMQLLAQAIAEDNPALAEPVFFPVVAYAQVKAIEKPERDWKARLWRAFERNVHEYHQKLGADAAAAKLHSVTVREAGVRFMKPGSEGNRLGYFRVTRNELRFTLANGSERAFEITSLISWRGEWFVVHLNGFG